MWPEAAAWMSVFLARRKHMLFRRFSLSIVHYERPRRSTIGESSKGKRRRQIDATRNFDKRFALWITAGKQSRGLSLRSDSSAKRPIASVRQRHNSTCVCSNRCRSDQDEARRHRTCVARVASRVGRFSSAERTTKAHPRHRSPRTLSARRSDVESHVDRTASSS